MKIRAIFILSCNFLSYFLDPEFAIVGLLINRKKYLNNLVRHSGWPTQRLRYGHEPMPKARKFATKETLPKPCGCSVLGWYFTLCLMICMFMVVTKGHLEADIAWLGERFSGKVKLAY